MRGTKLTRQPNGCWRLTYEQYVEIGIPGPEPTADTLRCFESALRRVIFRTALEHCPGAFRNLMKQVMRYTR